MGSTPTFYFVVESGVLTKVGQYPSIADIQQGDIARYRKSLGATRASELTRAIGLAAHGIGIGAYVYLRRVFESLLDVAALRHSR